MKGYIGIEVRSNPGFENLDLVVDTKWCMMDFDFDEKVVVEWIVVT